MLAGLFFAQLGKIKGAVDAVATDGLGWAESAVKERVGMLPLTASERYIPASQGVQAPSAGGVALL